MRFTVLFALTCIVGFPMTIPAQPHIEVEPLEIGDFMDEDVGEWVINIFNGGDARLTFRIEIDFLGGPDGWLAVWPVLGVLPAGGDQDLIAVIWLHDLLAGQYFAEIHILNNDPDNGDVTVRARAEVFSAPQIELWWEERLGFPDLINWNQAHDPLYIGHPYQVLMTVTSVGNDRLEVQDIFSPNWRFTARPRSFSIAPGDSREVELTYESLHPGRQESELIIISNAFDQEELRIAVRAEASSPPEFTIPLPFGWSMVSAPVAPPERDIPTIFSRLTENGLLIMVKDGNGQFYIPEFDFNNIPGWDEQQGYQVKMSDADSLTISGVPIPADQLIPLRGGWNMIAYYPRSVIRAPVAFRNIHRNLLIGKDGGGHFYIPAMDFNNIPPLRQGEGYQVKVAEACSLEWAEAVPARLEMAIGQRGEPAGDEGFWAVAVTVRVFDDGDNLLPGLLQVDFAVAPNLAQIEPAEAQDGIAVSSLVYEGMNAFQQVEVTASVEGEDGPLEVIEEYVLPLQRGELTLEAEPLNWQFDRQRPNDLCNIRVWARLEDGQGNPISGGTVIFQVSRGNLFWFDHRNNQFEPMEGPIRRITGADDEANDEAPGEATVFLRGDMNDYFLDPFTLEVIVQVDAWLQNPALRADSVFLTFRRD